MTLLNTDTNQQKQFKTDTTGDFTFTSLNPGTYRVTVTATGFKQVVVNNIHLAAGDDFRADATLPVGQVSEVVNVTSDVSALQTDSSSIATTLTDHAVQDLPLNGRNFIGLVLLTPGVNEGHADGPTSGTYPADRRQTSSISINSQSESTNYQMIDGTDNIERYNGTIGVRPSIDAIAQVLIQTNTFTADVGRTGGGVINVITKSGTNAYHGSVYEFVRNDKFDSRPYEFGANLPISELRQNQYGVSVGGPVRKNKLFFFGDWEEERQVFNSNPTSLVVPTLAEEGDPSNSTGAWAEPRGQSTRPADTTSLSYRLPTTARPLTPERAKIATSQGRSTGASITSSRRGILSIRATRTIM